MLEPGAALPAATLADDSGLREACGVTGRSTFLFDAGETLTRVWSRLTVAGHAEDVLSKH